MRPLRVIVVDSDRASADAMFADLSALGQIVEVCYSADECLRCLATFRPDVVFLEVGLAALCDEIKERCKPNEVAIVGLKG